MLNGAVATASSCVRRRMQELLHPQDGRFSCRLWQGTGQVGSLGNHGWVVSRTGHGLLRRVAFLLVLTPSLRWYSLEY